MVVFTSIDRLQHLFWRFIDSGDAILTESALKVYSGAIGDGYRQIDNAIGEILRKAGREVTVLIVSDHGFGPLKKYFFLNKWLEELGLLQVKKGLSPKKFNFRFTNMHRVLTKIFRDTQKLRWTKKIPFPVVKVLQRDTDELIDWEKTKAYADPSGGININLRSREPYGVVEPGEVEELITYFKSRFSQLVDESEPQLEKIGDWILRKEEIYSGPYVEEAADLYYSINERSYLHNRRVDVHSKFGLSSLGSGMHRKNGVFIMSGPLCHQCNSISPRMIDIAPTVLYFMGLPVMKEMDGRILAKAINPDYLKSHTVQHVLSGEYREKSPEYSSEDEEKIREGLKGLGYLS